MVTTQSLCHPSGYQTPWHSHTRGQLCRITTGLLVIETENGRSVVPGKHIGWLPPGLRHAAFSESTIAGASLYLDPACCTGLPQEIALFDPDELVDALFTRLSVKGDATDPRILALLLDELADAPRVRFLLPMPVDPGLRKIARLLMHNVEDNHPVEQLARDAGMSVRTFNRRFLAETGMNYVNWRQLARVIRAMEWLAAGKPTGWIALSCGYSSISAFIDVFRRWTGKTPGQWGLK